MNKTQIINQESSTASDFELPCKPRLGPPRADAAPTQPHGRLVKHCVASAHGRSTLGGEKMGGFGVERPF